MPIAWKKSTTVSNKQKSEMLLSHWQTIIKTYIFCTPTSYYLFCELCYFIVSVSLLSANPIFGNVFPQPTD